MNIAVAGNTSLDAGVIESTAASALNSLTTGSLTASGEKNVSDYAGASASFSYSTMQGGEIPIVPGLRITAFPWLRRKPVGDRFEHYGGGRRYVRQSLA
ncbi:hypothetical protein RAA17_05645 [Komagataeibacter rhaeticus]|nr:hypothetical protein [Komagataeibacter rhaeticus]